MPGGTAPSDAAIGQAFGCCQPGASVLRSPPACHRMVVVVTNDHCPDP